jgi:hypothetical protein
MDATPLLLRTPVSQRDCEVTQINFGERATAARKVGANLYDAVK